MKKYFIKERCRNCHFLTKEFRISGEVYKNGLSASDRKMLVTNPDDITEDGADTLNCHFGIWDEGIIGKKERHKYVNEILRNNCFYFEHHPGMLFKGAEELQKRAQEAKELKKSNLYTRIGLWVAAIAAIANAVIGMVRYLYPIS